MMAGSPLHEQLSMPEKRLDRPAGKACAEDHSARFFAAAERKAGRA
jgi:hypothetical protein